LASIIANLLPSPSTYSPLFSFFVLPGEKKINQSFLSPIFYLFKAYTSILEQLFKKNTQSWMGSLFKKHNEMGDIQHIEYALKYLRTLWLLKWLADTYHLTVRGSKIPMSFTVLESYSHRLSNFPLSIHVDKNLFQIMLYKNKHKVLCAILVYTEFSKNSSSSNISGRCLFFLCHSLVCKNYIIGQHYHSWYLSYQ
jgi:hypothetical protein